MSSCKTCKFWYRGKKIHYSEDSVQYDGKPHPLAGKTVTERPWSKVVNEEYNKAIGWVECEKRGPGEFYGKCDKNIKASDISDFHLRNTTDYNLIMPTTSSELKRNSYFKKDPDLPYTITSADFGCNKWDHDDLSDKFEHTYIRTTGPKPLSDHIKELKELPDDLPHPIGIKGRWVLYSNSEETKVEPVTIEQVSIEMKDELDVE